MLLHAIDAALPVGSLAREGGALPLLHGTLTIKDALLSRAHARFGLLLLRRLFLRRLCAHGGRWSRARRRGDARPFGARHGWSVLDIGPWRCHMRRRGARR